MNKILYIFNKGGCLTQEAINAYLKGRVSKTDKDTIDKHMAECELCSDAMEGISSFSSPDRYNSALTEIRDERSVQKKNVAFTRTVMMGILSVAAMLVVVLAIRSVLLRNTEEVQIMGSAETSPAEIDSYIAQQTIPIRFSEKAGSANEKVDDSLRKKYTSEVSGAESTVPLAHLNTASIYSSEKEIIMKPDVEPLSEVLSAQQGLIRYPYHVMSHAPANLHLEMPEEKAVEEVFFRIEDMPKFQNKKYTAFLEYIQDELQYPSNALNYHMSGRVYVQFTVLPSGNVSNIEIIKGVNPILDNEVIRVVKSSPGWEPGRQRGKAVAVSLLLPVDFIIH